MWQLTTEIDAATSWVEWPYVGSDEVARFGCVGNEAHGIQRLNQTVARGLQTSSHSSEITVRQPQANCHRWLQGSPVDERQKLFCGTRSCDERSGS